MNKLLKVAFALVFFVSISAAAREGEAFAFEQAVLKAKIENQLAARYRSVIESRLDAGLSAVQATVISNGAMGAEPGASARCAPVKLAAGASFDVQVVPLLMRAGVRASSVRPSAIDDFGFQGVIVGARLSETLGSDYRGAFSSWLQKAVGSELGAVGRARVGVLAKQESNGVVGQQVTVNERMDEQDIATILLAIASAAFVAAGVFLLRSRMPQAPGPEAESNAVRSLELAGVVPSTDQLRQFERLQKRVSLIALAADEKLDLAIERWNGEGIDGRRKIAATIDSIFSEARHLSFDEGTQAQATISAVPFRVRNDVALLAVCRSFGSLVPVDAKGEILARAYSDLQAAGTDVVPSAVPRAALGAGMSAATNATAFAPTQLDAVFDAGPSTMKVSSLT